MARRADSYRRNRRLRDSDDEKGDDAVLTEAKERFKRVHDFESSFKAKAVADTKFKLGDSENGWQWPDVIRTDREASKRPSLTINKVEPLIHVVVNDFSMNRPSVQIKPVGRETSFKAAEAFEGLVRNIEYVSGAAAIYDDMHDNQVTTGIAYCRLTTRYVDPDSFDQEIVIEPIPDQTGVYLDPDIKQKDGSDAKYGFIFTNKSRKEFEREYPKLKDHYVSSQTGLLDGENWVGIDDIREAEYYRIVETADELVFMVDEAGTATTFKMSDAPDGAKALIKEIEDAAGERSEVKRRKITTKQLEWYKICGDHIIDRRDMVGQYIPIPRAPGVDKVIEGKLERKGLVRGLKDPQRMYNYNSSGQVEYGALQTRSPWVGPEAAFSGNTAAWNRANTTNAAYLTFKHKDAEGNPIPAPVRPEPPGISPAFIEGMKIASAEFEMASGRSLSTQQHNPAIERTPRAVSAREHTGDLATAHFLAGMSVMQRYIGMIIVDWVPKIYDTERVLQIMGRDGTQTNLTVQPDAEKSYDEKETAEGIEAIFNPKVGKYQVESDPGPSYGTQRQQGWDAFVSIVTGAPELINDIGDLMFRNADFPLADKIAERLNRKIKQTAPYLLSDDPSTNPAVQQLQQQIQQQSEQVAELIQELARYRLKLVGKDNKYDIQAFDALTKRITAISNAWPEVEGMGDEESNSLKQLVSQTLTEMLQSEDLSDVVDEAQGGEPGERLMQQAQKSPIDGQTYVPDPRRPGKFMRVAQ